MWVWNWGKEGAETHMKGPGEANAVRKHPLVPAGSHQGTPGQPHRQDREIGIYPGSTLEMIPSKLKISLKNCKMLPLSGEAHVFGRMCLSESWLSCSI